MQRCFPVNNLEELTESSSLSLANVHTLSTVKFLNMILQDAVNRFVSDIHFEPYENFYRIRFRIDGLLYEITRQPPHIVNSLTARLKVLANLDISERRLPQDGRFQLTLNNKPTEFRLSTCPTLYGEKAVVRIATSYSAIHTIEQLGMSENEMRLFNDALLNKEGMVLITGPTGSGKTITLYSALNKLNTERVNISSVEDPIEINITGINQVQVNPRIDLTFAKTLRAFLRQDPDILMVGEIRDSETANAAVKAAQTGHLVFSTLHTNNAPEALVRLASLGIEPFNIASSLLLIAAQRLVRCLCNHCKEQTPAPIESAILEKTTTIYKAKGCSHCNEGYSGRIGIYEILPISKAMATLIIENAGPLKFKEQARSENIPSLWQSGLSKVITGITSLEELNRVVKEI